MDLRSFGDLRYLYSIYYEESSNVNYHRATIDLFWVVPLDNASLAWRLVVLELDSLGVGKFRA